jgi:hypothetical protein
MNIKNYISMLIFFSGNIKLNLAKINLIPIDYKFKNNFNNPLSYKIHDLNYKTIITPYKTNKNKL